MVTEQAEKTLRVGVLGMLELASEDKAILIADTIYSTARCLSRAYPHAAENTTSERSCRCPYR